MKEYAFDRAMKANKWIEEDEPELDHSIVYLDMHPANVAATPGKGELNPDYVFVGIAPSPNRPIERKNEPFGARSYKFIQKLISGKSVYITNLIKTPWPLTSKVAASTLRVWYSSLLQEIKVINPQKRIVAFGTDVAKVLCPGFTSLREDHGTLFYNPEFKLCVIPTYHPSAAGRDPSLLKDILRDMQRCYTLPDPKTDNYVVFTGDQISDLPFLKPGTKIYLDIETDGLSLYPSQPKPFHNILSIGFSVGDRPMVYQIHQPSDDDIRALLQYFWKGEVTLVGHNFQFDLVRLLWKAQVAWPRAVEDTLVMAHIQGEQSLSLKHLTSKFTNRPGSRAFGSFESPDYLTEDVLSTKELYAKMEERTNGPCYIRPILGRLVSVFSNMEVRGVFIDRPLLFEVEDHYHEALDKSDVELKKYGDINWNSNQQAAQALLNAGVKLIEKTETGAYSVKEAVLLPLSSSPAVAALLEHREATKNLGFVKQYGEMTTDEHPFLHSHLKLHGTETGRLSSVDPNLQQVPRIGPIKQIFQARFENGSIGLIDLSQAELRVVAMLSGDTQLAAALAAEDVHLAIASKVFRKPMADITPAERKKSKGVTFGLLYGGSPVGLAGTLNTSPSDISTIFREFFGTFPSLAEWLKRTGNQAIDDGYIDSIFGRRRYLEDIIRSEGPNGARRKAINTPVQSAASDIMLCILDYVALALPDRKLKSRPIFTVHDSTLLEVFPGEEEAVAKIVQRAFLNLSATPLGKLELYSDIPIMGELKFGDSWAAVESTNESYNPRLSFDINN